MKIETKDDFGRVNGWLIPVWNSLESDYRPSQVYVTAVLPGMRKGPHLHHKRHGMFCCVSGNADIITRTDGVYTRHADIGFDHRLVSVPPGTAAEIIGKGGAWDPALIINMPTPGWAENDQDEWPVEDWSPNV